MIIIKVNLAAVGKNVEYPFLEGSVLFSCWFHSFRIFRNSIRFSIDLPRFSIYPSRLRWLILLFIAFSLLSANFANSR